MTATEHMNKKSVKEIIFHCSAGVEVIATKNERVHCTIDSIKEFDISATW